MKYQKTKADIKNGRSKKGFVPTKLVLADSNTPAPSTYKVTASHYAK